MEKMRVSERQLGIFVFMYVLGSSILVAPVSAAAGAKQDAWISILLGTACGALLILLYNGINKRFPDSTLMEINEKLLGKWLGKTVSLFFFFYFFLICSGLLREIGDFMTTQILPETPVQTVYLLFLSVVLLGARLGIEPLARTAEILLPWVIGMLLLLILFLIPEMRIENLQPVFTDGLKPVIRGMLPYLGTSYLELVVFLMVLPYVRRKEKGRKAFLIGSFLGSLILFLVTLTALLVLGAELTARQVYPSYILARKVSIGGFVERIEALMAGIWIITIFIKLTLSFYASAIGLAQTFRLKEYKPLLLPLGMILTVLSLVVSPNIVYTQTVIRQIWPPYSLTFGFVLPLLLLTIGIRKKV
ncbi:endospore germination permease [Bacillaceae bacterium]